MDPRASAWWDASVELTARSARRTVELACTDLPDGKITALMFLSVPTLLATEGICYGNIRFCLCGLHCAKFTTKKYVLILRASAALQYRMFVVFSPALFYLQN